VPERSDPGARKRGALLGLIALLLVAPAPAAGDGELLLGAVPHDIPAVMHQRLKPLADYLSQELGRPVRLRLSPDYTEAVNEVANGTVDIAYLAPVAYVRANAAGGTRAIAGTVTRGRNTFRLVLVTRTDSPIREPKDLIGRRFAFGDTSAYLQPAVLLDAGIRTEQLGSHRFLGSFDNVARGVMSGDFDAGIVKDTTAYQWKAAACGYSIAPRSCRRSTSRSAGGWTMSSPATSARPCCGSPPTTRGTRPSSMRSIRAMTVSPRSATATTTSSAAW